MRVALRQLAELRLSRRLEFRRAAREQHLRLENEPIADHAHISKLDLAPPPARQEDRDLGATDQFATDCKPVVLVSDSIVPP